MKKWIIGLLITAVLGVALPVHAGEWMMIAKKWDGVSVAAATDEFAAPLTSGDIGSSYTAEWRFEINCPTATAAQIVIVYEGQTKTTLFNNGTQMAAGAGGTFYRMIPKTATIDPQHVTDTQNCQWDIYIAR